MDDHKENVLKQLVDGGAVSINAKYQQVRTVKLNTRFMFAANQAPKFADKSNGIYRRFVPILVTAVVGESDHILGLDHPEWWERSGELPGILNWALEGLKRLRARGWKFEVPASLLEHVEEIRLESDLMRAYLAEHYRVAQPDEKQLAISSTWMLEQREKYARDKRKDPGSLNDFNAAVRSLFPKAVKESTRFPGNKFKQAWKGLVANADSGVCTRRSWRTGIFKQPCGN